MTTVRNNYRPLYVSDRLFCVIRHFFFFFVQSLLIICRYQLVMKNMNGKNKCSKRVKLIECLYKRKIDRRGLAVKKK